MRDLLCWLIILLHLQCFLPAKHCEETGQVTAVLGEPVTLQVSVVEAQQIRKILWVTSRGVLIATSYPGRQVEIREDFYANRLDATSDGSIIIKDVKKEDGGIMKATIYLLDEDDCSQTYNLSIVDKCGKSKNVSAKVGGNVTLQVEEKYVGNWFWERPVGVHFATTKPDGYFDPRGNQYNGRLMGSHDGSLTLTKLSAKDNGDYRAVILPPDGGGCAQIYNVYVSDACAGRRAGVDVYVITGITVLVTIKSRADKVDLQI
ncbi:SLAM family member 5-like [Phyllobates terribilis]|uniref:SLAM family member 5-like n=1 Tax=Phyllobates terribilis TaxID=111132 RepID=UPI003CCAB491